MTATSRKAPLIVLLLAGLAASLAVPSAGIARRHLVVLALAGVVALVPRARATVVRWLDSLREVSARRRAIIAVVIAVLSAIYLLATALYQQRDLFPKYHDENMHLVQIQLLAHGMLWRAPHPLADAFETFHVLTEPVYASIYFPGTALLYVPSVWFHLPRWFLPLMAAGASVGLLVRIVGELLDARYGLLAAVLMLSATQFRSLSVVVMSHGVMILLGLLLVWAFLCWRSRGRTARWALLIGAFAGWAAITRPVDAICWAAPVGLAMMVHLRGAPLRRWIATGALIVAGAAPFLALQVVFNYGVTGNPLMTPYRLSADLFTPQISYGFHDYDPTVRPKTTLTQKILYYDLFTIPAAEQHRLGAIVRIWVEERLPLLVYCTLPSPLLVTLIPASLLALRSRWVLWAPLVACIAAYAVFAYFLPNYIAIYTAPVIYAVLLGVRAIVDTFPDRRDCLTTFLFVGVLGICLTSLPETSDLREDNRPTPVMELNNRLDRGMVVVDGRAQTLRKPAIVLVKYRKSENPHEEPVYTIDAAWPDDSQVIRAHDLGEAKNLELLRYYAELQPDRHVYFLDRGDLSVRYAGQAGELWSRLRGRTQATTGQTTAPTTQAPP